MARSLAELKRQAQLNPDVPLPMERLFDAKISPVQRDNGQLPRGRLFDYQPASLFDAIASAFSPADGLRG